MFTAILFACFLYSTDKCVQIIDTRGPYTSETWCVMRLKEMKEDSLVLIKKNNLDLKIVGGKCKHDGST